MYIYTYSHGIYLTDVYFHNHHGLAGSAVSSRKSLDT